MAKASGVLIGVSAAATVWAAGAAAADYVVIRSNDPELPVGALLTSGARLSPRGGREVTLMRATGEQVALARDASAVPVAVPGSQNGPGVLATIAHLLVSPPPPRHGLAATRGPDCPPAASLVTLEKIAGSVDVGCSGEAWQALHGLIGPAPRQ
jgi:hypothetical protein